MNVCRGYGISKATLFNWRKKYSEMEAAQFKKLKTLQDENRRLKQVYSELSRAAVRLDDKFAKDNIGKKL